MCRNVTILHALACSRLSVSEDDRKAARNERRAGSGREIVAHIRSSPLTESMEQATYARVSQRSTHLFFPLANGKQIHTNLTSQDKMLSLEFFLFWYTKPTKIRTHSQI